MAARNKPAGIRVLVYGIGKGKVRIEGLSVSSPTEMVRYRSFVAENGQNGHISKDLRLDPCC